MIIGHPGSWQQFQLRLDNKNLSVMEMKSKYLREQYLFESQILNQIHQQNMFMNGGGGGPLPSSGPTPPPPTYSTEVQFYFAGDRTQITNSLGWDPEILDNWNSNAFGTSEQTAFEILESGGDETTLIITLKGNNGEVILGDEVFISITRLTRVIDVNGNCIIEIGKNCFAESYVTDVVLDAVVSLGAEAFNGCTSLDAASFNSLLTIPNASVDSITYGVFNSCPLANLDFELNFPALQTIGAYAFYDCVGFRKLASSTISSIGFRAFGQSSIESSQLDEIDISCVTSIGDRAFQNVDTLATITLPSNNTYDPNAFNNVGLGFGDATFNLADTGNPAFNALSGWTITYV
jgi:hypothetical protein